jgi:serine protease AprX
VDWDFTVSYLKLFLAKQSMVSGSMIILFKKFRFASFLLFLSLLILACPALAEETPSSKIILEYPAENPKVDFKTRHLLDEVSPDSEVAVWVFFTDKGIKTDGEYRKAVEEYRYQISERSAKRRMLRGKKPIFDFTDIPVKTQYLDELISLGVKIRVVSKWLNSASVMANKNQIEEIEKLSFVRAIQKVVTFYRKEPSFSREDLQKFYEAPKDQILGYGESYAQLAQIHVPELHNLGYSGKGVLITMLDTGYFIDHPAFDSILNSGRLVATHDFINGDDNVQDGPDQQREHGTYTFSAVGGFVNDTLIGPAFGADFALAKTEIVLNHIEIQIEEDNWVAGAEWADSLGADVISSSLGYNRWDDGTGYTYQDMNGHTTKCTVAADLAVSKGIVVVNAAGNERQTPWHYILAPADGDSVIAVGAVDLQGHIASFSSAGPTYDGRIKPDVVACGVNTFCASPYGGYTHVGGTSLSTPLVAGACALLLEIHPDWTPHDVISALQGTASQACRPDTLKGWGIANAYPASGLDTVPQICIQPESFDFSAVHGEGEIPAQTLHIYNIGGGGLRWQAMSDADWLNLEPSSDTAFVNQPSITHLTVDISDLSSELHQATLTISGDDTLTRSVTAEVTLVIHSTNKIFVFPNPFSDSLTVFVDKSDAKDNIKISIFTVAGELVYQFPPEDGGDVFRKTWDGKNEDGKRVSDGIYLIKVDINEHSEIVKVAKIK